MQPLEVDGAYRDIAAALGAIPAASLAAALALTVAGYTVVIGY